MCVCVCFKGLDFSSPFCGEGRVSSKGVCQLQERVKTNREQWPHFSVLLDIEFQLFNSLGRPLLYFFCITQIISVGDRSGLQSVLIILAEFCLVLSY